MTINEFQKQVLDSFGEMASLPQRTAHTKQSAFIHLTEEVGEIARQITNEYHRREKFDRDNLAQELSDSMMYLVLLAKMYEVDIEKEMKESVTRVVTNTEKLMREASSESSSSSS